MYIPYAIMLIVMRFKWKKPRIQKYIDVLVLYVVLMGASYILSRGLQTFEGYIIHELLYLLITISIIYAEHYERLHIPLESVRTYYQQSDILDNTMITVNVVAHNLRELMNDPTIWQDPELTADKVVKLVGTNRTYIQHAARQLGFANLSDMVHRRRIDYICECLRKDPNANIQDLFWDAGYRSRATAWRNFTNIVGRTPTEFVARNTPPDKIT
jgi:AraC-like DNA-binding protein